jgi:F0F1-type ATP synthase membrane subunit c/vacuolar-type H+-ATPase subunit K
MSGEATFLFFALCLGLTIKWAVQGAASNPSGTANFFGKLFK